MVQLLWQLKLIILRIISSFTFHYGSITIPIAPKFLTLSYKYLHSIMVQLLSNNYYRIISTYLFTFHYGSITIIMKNYQFISLPKFTFHYGSITI